MSLERPAKRVRQACEPCRRKKSKCPGEKPVCSHCARLRQQCQYADENHGRESDFTRHVSTPVSHLPPAGPSPSPLNGPKLEDRVRLLEAQLSDVVSGRVPVLREESSPARSRVQSPQQSLPRVNIVSQQSELPLPPWEVIDSAGYAYLTYCDSQPLPLFHRQTFRQTLGARDNELLFAILALALRFTDEEGVKQHVPSYVEASRKIVAQKVFDGTIELSTIQSLCLLSLVDFTNGNTRRASVHSSLAMNLAHNAGLTSEAYGNLSVIDLEERRRCFWSLFLLKRLHGADFSILDFTGEENFPFYPSTPDRPLDSEERLPPHQENTDGKGIIAYALQLSQVWFKITKYARRRGKPSPHPPWSPQSEYSIILAEQMDFETRVPYTYRFRPGRFSHRSLTELNNNRNYWGPWLFLQIVYHTSILLLNHPLLVSLRLRNFKSMIPEIFLQHTSDMIASHASWVIHLIEMVEGKGFKVTDPFLAYCVAIVATIYLQESFVEDADTRTQKKENFHKCLSFVRTLGGEWPHVSGIAHKLSSLSETVSASYPSTNSSNPNNHASSSSSRQSSPPASSNPHPTRSLLINLSLFWEILEYPAASERPGSARHLFGPSLYSVSRARGDIAASEIAQTSPLPEPTRVEGQDFVSVGGSAPGSRGPREDSAPQLGGGGMALGVGIGDVSAGGMGIRAAQMDVPFVYSDEELAVLAESFFSQRGEFDGGMGNDWWNTGNL